MKITTLSFTLFCSITLGLTACGDGSSYSSDNNEATKHTFDGSWRSACDYDADNNEADQATVNINGNVNIIEIKTYNTSDCSGVALSMIGITFDTQYKGEYATSSCIAEKINLKATAASSNGVALNSEQIKDVSSEVPPYQLICIDSNGALRFSDAEDALNGSTPEKRPTTMDMEGNGLIKQ